MIRVHVFVEGQTEETFVREVLSPHFLLRHIYLNPILVRTSATGKGGVVTYAKIKPQLDRKCREDSNSFITTMFDFYRLPQDFPGKNSLPPTSDPLQKAAYIEQQMAQDIGFPQFLPNIIVYEFEGLLYSNPQAFLAWFDQGVVDQLHAEREVFPSPEHINDGATTAPSKRILKWCPGYEKPLHGSLIAIDIGLDTIRQQCQHFDEWLTRLEAIR